jgi:AraC-like DNA-binding protein
LQPVVTEVERLLFRSDVAAAGAFRCSATHGLFTDSGPASGYLFVFPRSSTKLLFAGGRTITATPAATIFYNQGQEYRRERIDGIDSSDWFMVAADVVRDIVARYDESAADRETKIFPFASGRAGGELYLKQRRVHQHLAAGVTADPLQMDEAILDLLDAAVRDAYGVRRRTSYRTAAERQDIVAKVVALIAARPAANPSLRELAAAGKCSPYHLCHIFRDATGYSITAYKHALRLHLSLGALRCRDLNKVARSLGYASHSHFTAYFRRHFGKTPSECRGRI